MNAAQLLKKAFREDFTRIRELVKNSSIHKQMKNLNKNKLKYAAPGYQEISVNVHNYLMSLLYFEYKQHTLTLADYIENNSIDFFRENYNENQIQNYPNRFERNLNKTANLKRNGRKNKSQRPLAVMNQSQQIEIVEAHQNPERIDIEKRIYIDSLKRYLYNKFEREIISIKTQGNSGEFGPLINPKS